MVKNLSTNAGDAGLIPKLGRSPGRWDGNPLRYSCLENPMDRESMGSQRVRHDLVTKQQCKCRESSVDSELQIWSYWSSKDSGSESCLYLQSNLSKLWSLFCKLGKGPDAGKDWGQEEKESKDNEMVGWHHWLKGHEFEQTPEAVKVREAWHAAVHVVTKKESDTT